MKFFEVKYTTHGKPHSIHIEGAASLTDAVKTAEMVFSAFHAEADICGAFQVYKEG